MPKKRKLQKLLQKQKLKKNQLQKRKPINVIYPPRRKQYSGNSTQPGVTTVSYLGGTTGWSTVAYQNFNSDYIAYTYNSNAGVGTRTPASYQR